MLCRPRRRLRVQKPWAFPLGGCDRNGKLLAKRDLLRIRQRLGHVVQDARAPRVRRGSAVAPRKLRRRFAAPQRVKPALRLVERPADLHERLQ